MGIDYNGGMIVGALGSDLNIPEKYEYLSEWAEDNNMTTMSLYYDADSESQYMGFEIEDILVSEINNDWIKSLKTFSKKFEDITGVPAKLIGTQNIY